MATHAPATPSRLRSAGFTLLEVTICLAVLTIALAGTIHAILTASQMNSRAESEMLATAAAEETLAQFRQTPFANIYADYVSPGNTAKRFFTVPGLPPLPRGLPHGEVIVILDETPDEGAYGRDLNGDGVPDGVDLNGNGLANDVLVPGEFAVDIDGDGAFSINAVPPTNIKLLPVVVLISWGSGEGIQRHQVMTMVVNRTP